MFKEPHTEQLGWFLKRGFGHCFVLTRIGNLIMAIEPMSGTVNHLLTESELKNMITAQKMAGHTVVHLNHAPDPRAFVFRSPIMTCAGYLAYTMGFSFFGITPYQLYKKVLKRGGEII